MKKFTLLAIVCLLLISSLCSELAEYPIGTFSFLGNKQWAYDHRDAFNAYMDTLGYNTSIIELFSTDYPAIDGTVSTNLAGMFNSMEAHGLKAAVMDKAYSPSTNNSSYAYTTGSYMRFEAEFSDWRAVKPTDIDSSAYWYGSRETRYKTSDDTLRFVNRVGEKWHPIDTTPSYGYVWKCEATVQDSAGFAYGDLRYRWKQPPQLPYPDSLDIRIGQEFLLKKLDPNVLPADDLSHLYIRYAFMLDGTDSLNDEDVVLSFTLVGYPYSGGGHVQEPDSLEMIVNGVLVGTEYQLTKSEYASLPGSLEFIGFKYLDVEVTYAELKSKNLFVVDGYGNEVSSWRHQLVNINPRVYWYDNCDLFLDFIEIRDQLYKNIESNPGVYEAAISTRIADLQTSSGGIISHIFTLDEPYQPQFKSYRDLERTPYLSGRTEKQFTAVNIRGFRKFPMGDPSSSTKCYNNVEAFIGVTQPKYLMVNPYPITPEINWNYSTSDKNHIQSTLDEFVLDKYRDAKVHSVSQGGGEFYACVQAWGRWKDDHWDDYILPPPETQEMMQYLPLCFGADGIFNYRLYGSVSLSPDSYDEYGALISDNLSSPSKNLPTFNAIQSANLKIQKYGPLIKELNWVGSNTILESSTEPYIDTALLHITEITNAYPTPSGPYGCYVQSGYFIDADANPSIMLVNRRANYRDYNMNENPGVRGVNLDDHLACYPAFDSQVVKISISESANSVFGDYIGLYDAYSDSLYLCDGLNRTI